MRTEDFPFSHLTTDRMSHQPTNWVKVWGRSWLVAPSKIPSFNTFKREDIYFAYLFSIFASGEWTFFIILSTPTPQGKCSISGFFHTRWLLTPSPHQRSGGQPPGVPKPTQRFGEPTQLTCKPAWNTSVTLLSLGRRGKTGRLSLSQEPLDNFLNFLMTNQFLCLFLAVHAYLSI